MECVRGHGCALKNIENVNIMDKRYPDNWELISEKVR